MVDPKFRYVVSLFAALMAAGCGAQMAAEPPPRAAQAASDPAVLHANAQRAAGSAEYREGWFGTGDARLHYVEAGSGPLVIFYHGFPSFWYCWFDQMEALKFGYRVVAVDAPGAGLSARPTDAKAYHVANLARQLDDFARHLNGDQRFTLVGHDWGAALSFAFAQGYPDRLNGVVGIAAPPYNQFLDIVRNDPEQRKRSNYMPELIAMTPARIAATGMPQKLWAVGYGEQVASGGISVAEGELFRNALADPLTIDGGIAWYRANVPAFADIGPDNHWPQGAGKIKPPALLIWGGRDPVFVDAVPATFADYAERPRVVTVAGANHFVMMEAPGTVNAELSGFLKANSPD
ncbi:MAG: hypothetical protein RLZZ58_106 [Pseudomonadota bacterium]